jgi:hypothetical protein
MRQGSEAAAGCGSGCLVTRRSFVRASGDNFGLGAKAFPGSLPLRTWAAASRSRRIRADLKLARLSRARVFTEHAAGKEVIRLCHASRDFEQIANNKTAETRL